MLPILRGWARSVVVGVVITCGLVMLPSGAGAEKLQKACTVLSSDEIAAVLPYPVGEPDGSGSKLGCSFDIGEGLGEPGGGMVITQYHTGSVAKSLWSTAKKSQEKVGQTHTVYWDPGAGIASGFKKGRLFAVSVTITGKDDTEQQAEAVELVEAGLDNLK